MPAHDLFTTTEAAAELGLSPPSVRYAIMRGILQPMRLGARTVLITRDEIERYRREHLGRRGKIKPARTTN